MPAGTEAESPPTLPGRPLPAWPLALTASSFSSLSLSPWGECSVHSLPRTPVCPWELLHSGSSGMQDGPAEASGARVTGLSRAGWGSILSPLLAVMFSDSPNANAVPGLRLRPVLQTLPCPSPLLPLALLPVDTECPQSVLSPLFAHHEASCITTEATGRGWRAWHGGDPGAPAA